MSTTTSQSQVKYISDALGEARVTASDFVLTLLERQSLQDHECTINLLDNSERIIDAFSKNARSAPSTYTWARKFIQKKTMEAIRILTANEDWHFNAEHASAKDLEDFKIEEMAADMKEMAPDLWHLLQLLLSRDELDDDGGQNMETPSDREDFDETGGFAGQSSGDKESRNRKRRETIRNIKTAVIISILMQSRNAKCNALECVFGIFLHSANTPEKVIQALAHMGISISASAIQHAIHLLSAETADTLREMGQTLLVGYAYDNFDINFPTIVPTIEKATDPLTHLTSGALIYLEHGVELEDLRCSEELWANSEINPNISPTNTPSINPNLDMLHPEDDHPSGLTRRERWNVWKFKSDLFEYSNQAEFTARLRTLEAPESVEQIPIVQMRYAPARSMDINQSTHAGNISAVENLLSQGGVGAPETPLDPKEKDPSKIALHRRLQQLGVLLRRSIEATPWRRHQFMVFVMGFFHLKMAAADAIWRIFIEPKHGRLDENSLMMYVAQSRPRETGKIGSNPGFRRMHEVIGHNGIVLRLDAWRVEAKRRNPAWTSLEEFAKAKPSPALINEMAEYLTEYYVSGGEVDIYSTRSKGASVRDEQHENILLLHQYLLLYEETSFAMNRGDIGRLETTFPPWISIFRAVGKHKYSAHMTKYLTDVHFNYPPRLARAIRYNSLVNPTGVFDKFRGVDWVEESMINLYTKHTFGGSGSNYTKARVIEESTLIKVFHSCHRNIERNFCLTNTTRRHAPPNMTKTFEKMAEYLIANAPNEHRPGRKSSHCVPDMLDKGEHIVYNIAGKAAIPDDDGVDQVVEDEDLEVEYM
ncbi:hypothetical protein R3P38DRAFT_3321655 [Favolaschia claudopus]|uniref:DUF6589 domain-containing protein n=1 Tax=Favolaschia claudopus TaxID=2862362 RepID=A0AAW0ARG6_9AGAR